MDNNRTYTIMEAAKLSGLPESTLRYYETIGIIDPIKRDASSKHRVYSEDDINLVISIACLNATGLSIESMRTYLKNRSRGAEGAKEQVELLEAQRQHLENEIHFMQLRLLYVQSKVDYWKAVQLEDEKMIEDARVRTVQAAEKLKLPTYQTGLK